MCLMCKMGNSYRESGCDDQMGKHAYTFIQMGKVKCCYTLT
jgi:hypothetical protein